MISRTTSLLAVMYTIVISGIVNSWDANDVAAPYFETFKAEAKARGQDYDNVKVNFEWKNLGFIPGTKEAFIGYAPGYGEDIATGMRSKNINRVFLSRELFYKLNDIQREIVIFHEILHEVCHMSHYNDYTRNIMTPGVFPMTPYYRGNREGFLNTAFKDALTFKERFNTLKVEGK